MKAKLQMTISLARAAILFSVLQPSLHSGAALSVRPQSPGGAKIDTRDLQAFLDPIFAEEMEKEHLPGAVFVLVKDGKILFAKGYGVADVEKQTPVTPDKTIFRIGSITKVFTAMAIAQLADRKKLDLNDDVNKYLVNPKVEDKYGEPVGVRHLLTHTAGFDQIGTGRQAPNPQSRRTLGEFLNGQLIRVRPPGQVSCYDTYGITLAGYLVERVSGLSYADYLRKNIFEPLRMTRASVEVTDALKSDLAVGYGFRDGKYFPQRYEYYVTMPASSIDATAMDMAQFMIAILGDGGAGRGRFLSRAMARQIKQPQFTNHEGFPGFAYGFWEDIRYGQRAIYHGGAMLGYLSHMYLLPERNLGFFIAYNRDEEAGGGPARLRDTVTAKLMGKLFPSPDPTPPKMALAIDVERFAGSYTNNIYCHTCFDGEGWGWSVFPIRAAGKGVLEFFGARWLAVAPSIFQNESGRSRVAFREDKSGQITHMVFNNMVFDRLGDRLLDEVFGASWRDRPAEPLVARVYRDSGQWKKAAEAYQSIVTRRPEDGRAFYYLGDCLLNSGEPDKALTALNRALELRRWPPDTSYLMAVAYALKKDKDLAFEWLDKAIKLGLSSRDRLKNDARLSNIRDDSRFKSFVER